MHKNTPKYRQQWIFDLLKVDNLTYLETFSKYSATFSKTERTFNEDWKKANKKAAEYHNKVNDAKDNASIEQEVEAVKSGLKRKIEHQLDLQTEIEGLSDMLRQGYIAKKIKIAEDEYEKIEVFGVYEITQINRMIDEKRRELFKLDGLYAPTKNAFTDGEGKPINNTTKFVFVTSPDLPIIPTDEELGEA